MSLFYVDNVKVDNVEILELIFLQDFFCDLWKPPSMYSRSQISPASLKELLKARDSEMLSSRDGVWTTAEIELKNKKASFYALSCPH